MRRKSKRGARPESGQLEAGYSGPSRVHEHDPIEAGDRQGVLDLELVIQVGLDPGKVQGAEPLDETRSQPVVPAARISDPEDEQARPHPGPGGGYRLRQSRIRPRGSTIETSSGIDPKAWVAQLRQGS